MPVNAMKRIEEITLLYDISNALNENFDLRKAGLQSEKDAIRHYARYGFFEKRTYCPPDKALLSSHDDTRLRQLKNIARFSEQHYQVIRNENYNLPITVSVIITLYNYANYIERCVQSVLNSTI